MNKEREIRGFHATLFNFVSFEPVLLATVYDTAVFNRAEFQRNCTIPIPNDVDDVETLRQLYAATLPHWSNWMIPTLREVLTMNHRIGRKHPDIDKMMNSMYPPKRLIQLIREGLIDCGDVDAMVAELQQRYVMENSTYGMLTK